MAGLGARLAGERYLGIGLDRGRHAAELKAALGGIKGPLMKVAQLLAPFGLDAADPGFWSKGLGVIARFIDELEALG